MKHVKRLTGNTFSVSEEGTLSRNITIVIKSDGNIAYKNYHNLTFIGDIDALKNFIIKEAIKA